MIRYPKLRDGLVIRKVAEGDDVAYTVCDSAKNRYFRIDPYTRLVAIHLDGKRSLAEVSRLCQEAMPYNDMSLPVVEEAVQDLSAIGLLEDPYSKNLLLLERARARRPQIAELFRNMLLWHVGVWDPDKFLDRTIDRMRWLFQPWLAAVVTAGLIWSIWLVFVNRHRMALTPASMLGLDDGGNVAVGFAVLLLILLVVGVVHEFGHAYACKHFGGEVHRMGFMLMYFTPCFFCDVSHSMLFENRWQRIWVALAGIYFESFLTIAAAVAWWITPQELYLHDLSYRVLIMGLLSGVVFNLNPLLKFDGYFVLSDLLQISELREKSLRYVPELLKRPFRRGAPPGEVVVGRRRRRAYVIYGLLTFVYSYVVIVCFFGWLRTTLVGAWREAGFLMFAGLVGAFVRKPVGKVLARTAGFARRPSRAAIPWVLGALLLAVAGQLVRTPAHVTAKVRIVSASREAIRAQEQGRIAAVLVRAGDRVMPRQVVVVLENDSVLAAQEEAQSRSGEASIRLAGALVRFDPAQYRNATHERVAALADEAWLGSSRARLHLAAREGGVVLTHRPGDLLGHRVEVGDTLLIVARDDRIEIEGDVREQDVGEVEPGGRIAVRLRSRPGAVLPARIERVYAVRPDEAGGLTRFQFRARLEGDGSGVRLGETGTARIDVGRLNLYERFGRAWARLVRADFWM